MCISVQQTFVCEGCNGAIEKSAKKLNLNNVRQMWHTVNLNSLRQMWHMLNDLSLGSSSKIIIMIIISFKNILSISLQLQISNIFYTFIKKFWSRLYCCILQARFDF